MWEYFSFWVMKWLAEAAIGAALIALVLLVCGIASIPGYLKQRRCSHDSVREDGKCDAWCCACGKNLGFIGAWRKKHQPSGLLGGQDG